MNFTMTRSAQRFIRMMIMADGGPSAGFRMHVTPGGCSGLNAEIAVLPEPAPGDAVVEKDGLKLFLPAESRMLLDGVTIDFTDTAAKTGLVFQDPNAATCSSHTH
ncbi:HesB/IscA family protein [Xanthobacter autotrophicus]|uniref:HesB/IscA family protein n=1 Tax=Xanthobacter autotrophicus TaxID=280 RepID=UPI003729AFE1